MNKMCFKRKKEELKVLKDLQGKPYKFYRGKSYESITVGRYFCSCFDIAKRYRLYDENPIIETEIAVRKPLVIDATMERGHSSFGYLHVRDCKLYPEEKRDDLIRYIMPGSDTLSTDEVLEWAMSTKDIDAVIVKNVREGNAPEIPIYDVMVWKQENLVNARNVNGLETEYEYFRENAFKRVDLSIYISGAERDGVINITKGNGYFIEHTIQRANAEWYMEHELVVYSDSPIAIYCWDTCSYIVAIQMGSGIYQRTGSAADRIIYLPQEGCVRVKGVMQNWKYKIEIRKSVNGWNPPRN
ncbi:MAG: hypothetical protein MR355_03110 [Lachnospiraceae bacterium]|nr:hypothetical protein [Lachnospiraceae bacterium]